LRLLLILKVEVVESLGLNECGLLTSLGLSMKVIIQNDAKHGFSRNEMEAIVCQLPAAMTRRVESIVLCHCAESSVKISFHSKEQVVALYWPQSIESETTKSEAIEALLIALSIIAERGELPEHIGKALQMHHLKGLGALTQKCKKVLHQNAS
jgi:hypothetical protein